MSCLLVSYALFYLILVRVAEERVPFRHEQKPVQDPFAGNIQRIVFVCLLVVHTKQLSICSGFPQIPPGGVLARQAKVAATVEPRGEDGHMRGIFAIIKAIPHALRLLEERMALRSYSTFGRLLGGRA
jgi:hypothetical protein